MVATSSLPFTLPGSVIGIAVLIIVLLLLWVIVSLPVYAASRLVTKGKSLGQAMGATLGGALAYFIVFYGGAIILGTVLGSSGVTLAFLLALVVWLAVYRAALETSWFGAIAIVIVAWIVFFIIDIILVSAFGVTFPKFYPF